MEIAIGILGVIGLFLCWDDGRLRGKLTTAEQSNEVLRQRVETLSRRIVMMDAPVEYDVLDADILETEEIQ